MGFSPELVAHAQPAHGPGQSGHAGSESGNESAVRKSVSQKVKKSECQKVIGAIYVQ